MSYKVQSIVIFEKQAKKLIKKFSSLKSEIRELSRELKKNPVQGSPIGKNCYKIRLAIKSKGKGKSGGARIITNFVIADGIVYLLTMTNPTKKV